MWFLLKGLSDFNIWSDEMSYEKYWMVIRYLIANVKDCVFGVI